MDRLHRACILFQFYINTRKTVVIACSSTEPLSTKLYGAALAAVNKFTYLGFTVSNNLSLNAEIYICIGKAAIRTAENNNKAKQTSNYTYQDDSVPNMRLEYATVWI